MYRWLIAALFLGLFGIQSTHSAESATTGAWLARGPAMPMDGSTPQPPPPK